ncbi:MAG: FecR family protein [Bacteroidota bacterium]|nr:FecR family protein [Bacteroidota bacterium]MDP4225513.1 FecR family protein [Bacteroidota bacterium]MDP4273674.1 FecR family protein [Bacteroidota bacterium]
MDDKLKIKEFLNKLKLGYITPKELEELFSLLKDAESQRKVEELMSEDWGKPAEYQGTKSSEELLAQLHSRMKGELKPAASEIQPRSISNRLLAFMRYAAIFIFALGITWIGNRLFYSEKVVPQAEASNEITVPYGSKSRAVLPDGTIVNLNSGSKIKYASNFETNRNVYLEGEAFFKVKKDAKHPFSVQTSKLTIRVLGTVFNVKSYPEENTIETTLVSGSVQILEKDNLTKGNLKEIALLKPNQKAVFYKNAKENKEEDQFSENSGKDIQPNSLLTIEEGIKTNLYTAWKDNQLVFNNEKFEDIIPKLERWYNVVIDNQYRELNDSRLTGKFDEEPIDQAIKALQIIAQFHYTINKNKIIIYR